MALRLAKNFPKFAYLRQFLPVAIPSNIHNLEIVKTLGKISGARKIQDASRATVEAPIVLVLIIVSVVLRSI